MLAAVGASTIEDLYEDIPDALRLHRPLDLPEPFTAEADLIRHVDGILAKNRTTADNLSFLGPAAPVTSCPPCATRSTRAASS